jgi:hypothetical protein
MYSARHKYIYFIISDVGNYRMNKNLCSRDDYNASLLGSIRLLGR